ncbi:alkyl sulfatase dimerization domain-containing protein [Achromobacter anxifer]
MQGADAVKKGTAGVVLFDNPVRRDIVKGIHTIGGQGNSLAIETGRGVVVVDAGPGGKITAAMIANLRTITQAPVHAIVYSHGHNGYNSGVSAWREHAESRGDAAPVLIGHRGVARRYDRYVETAGLQQWLNGRQFRREFKAYAADAFPSPDVQFEDFLSLDCGDRRVELIHAPSETDDSIAVWLPQDRFLYAGPAFIRSIPNAGTPLRTFRDPMRWAESLERLQALGATILMPEFGDPVTRPEEIQAAFSVTVRALRYLRAEVVARMNQGMDERDILADMSYPAEIFGHPFLRPIYGCPEYIVREIWRSENGWWDRNPTTLHPAHPQAVAAALRAALGDVESVLNHARTLQRQGETQLALHVVDLLAANQDDDPQTLQARELKAELCVERAAQMASIVSRNILLSSAEDVLGLPIGTRRADDPAFEFSWN